MSDLREPERERTVIVNNDRGGNGGGGGGSWLIAGILIVVVVIGAFFIFGDGLLGGGADTNVSIDTPDVNVEAPDVGGGGDAPAPAN